MTFRVTSWAPGYSILRSSLQFFYSLVHVCGKLLRKELMPTSGDDLSKSTHVTKLHFSCKNGNLAESSERGLLFAPSRTFSKGLNCKWW